MNQTPVPDDILSDILSDIPIHQIACFPYSIYISVYYLSAITRSHTFRKVIAQLSSTSGII